MAAKARKKLLKSPSKTTAKSRNNASVKKTSNNWSQIFRFGESYSSLLLGVLVVIITTVLLVFLVRDRNLSQNRISQNTSSTNTEISVEPTGKTAMNGALTQESSSAASIATPTITQGPTSTIKPTSVPTKIPTKVPTVTMQPTKMQPSPVPSVDKNAKIHSVASGENLWTIAEKYYKSGYNWVDIQRANNLSNPGVIRVGMKLTIPNVAAKTTTIQVADTTDFGPEITGTTYKVEKGDHLWGIAVRAFNDGYRWVEIARVNNITTPSIIQPGLVLKLPRTAPQNPK